MSAIKDLGVQYHAACSEYARAIDLAADAETLLDTIGESDLFDQEVPILARILVEKMEEGIKLRKSYIDSLKVKMSIILDAMEAR
jgi:hypothetical protein